MKFFLLSIILFALVGVSVQNCSDEFKKAFLDKHNELRGKHGVGSLSLDETVNAFAQEWANHLASTGKLLGLEGFLKTLTKSEFISPFLSPFLTR